MKRRLLLGLLTAIGLALCAVDEEKIWREYVEWYRNQPISDSQTLKSYLDHLKLSGINDSELQKLSDTIKRLSGDRRDQLQSLFFDRTYSSDTPRFNTKPNLLLVEAVRGLKPGRALDIHMGQGRNAIFLASEGWEVTGFDYSVEGIRSVHATAKKQGLEINALVATHENFDFGRSQWDLIVMSYTWVPLRGEHIAQIIESLKPGGIIVFEHLMDESGSDGAAPWLPRPNELFKIFEDLRILRYEDVWTDADWAWRPERIARLVAEK